MGVGINGRQKTKRLLVDLAASTGRDPWADLPVQRQRPRPVAKHTNTVAIVLGSILCCASATRLVAPRSRRTPVFAIVERWMQACNAERIA
jgi:hypothetical protein